MSGRSRESPVFRYFLCRNFKIILDIRQQTTYFLSKSHANGTGTVSRSIRQIERAASLCFEVRVTWRMHADASRTTAALS